MAALYEEMGYDVNLTKSSYDGGIDVHAARTEVSLKEKLIMQCKRYTKKTIGVSDIRNLLGVVSDTKATKGVLITSSTFSSEAKKFEHNNPSIELELIDCKNLSQLLNANLGTYLDKQNRQDYCRTKDEKNSVTSFIYVPPPCACCA